MLRCVVLLLSLLFLLPVSAKEASNEPARVITLMTRDFNGEHRLVVVELPSKVKAVVSREAPGISFKDVVVDYPREHFERVWQRAAGYDLTRFEVDQRDSVDLAENYVVTIGRQSAGSSLQTKVYRLPKCAIDAELDNFVKTIANSLLPPNSPGKLEPCMPILPN